jgi:hypothetical protein
MKKKWATDSGQAPTGRKSVKRASSEFICVTASFCYLAATLSQSVMYLIMYTWI